MAWRGGGRGARGEVGLVMVGSQAKVRGAIPLRRVRLRSYNRWYLRGRRAAVLEKEESLRRPARLRVAKRSNVRGLCCLPHPLQLLSHPKRRRYFHL